MRLKLRALRLKLSAAVLALSLALQPGDAKAMPFIPAFLGGAATALGAPSIGGALMGLAGGAGYGAFAAGYTAFSAFGGLGAGILSTVLQFGLQYFIAQANKPKAESIQGNVVSATPVRQLHIGQRLVGGNVTFAESFAGQIFYSIHHGDNPCEQIVNHWFNDRTLTLDVNKWVTTAAFCHRGIAPWFRVEHHSGHPGQPVSAFLNGTFPEWDEDHVGAGCCYTVVFGNSTSQEARHRVYKHRGPLGLGEPSYFLEGRWFKCYDPRDEDQDVEDPSTWALTTNWALVLATFRIHRAGWNKHHSTVNWGKIAIAADLCDVEVEARDLGFVPRYRLNTSVPYNESRRDAEKRMLEAAAGKRYFDSQGRWYCTPGVWSEPTVVLGPNDILAIDCAPDGDGESEKNAFVAAYTDRRLAYKTTTSSPWKHPELDTPGVNERKLVVELPEIDTHNQAVLVSKTIGMRTRAPVKLAVIAGLRAMRCKEEMFCRIELGDVLFDGDYEIMAYEEAEDGLTFALQLVRSEADNWRLLPGEEGPLPTYDNSLTPDGEVLAPTGFDVQPEAVQLSGSNMAVRLAAIFEPPANPADRVNVQYRKLGNVVWLDMTSVSDEGFAYSDIVDDGATYQCQAFTETPGGLISTVVSDSAVAVADTVAPGPVTGASATPGGAGVLDYAWVAPASPNYYGARIYRGTVNDINSASVVRLEPGLMGLADSWQETGIAAGTYYTWIVAVNGSRKEASPVATGPDTVT